MSTVLRLVGPDLPNDIKLTMEQSTTVLQVKEAALAQWGAGATLPTLQQLRIIHQGRFLSDEKTLKDSRIPEGETVAMHLIIKQTETKQTDAEKAGDDKTPKCTCIIC